MILNSIYFISVLSVCALLWTPQESHSRPDIDIRPLDIPVAWLPNDLIAENLAKTARKAHDDVIREIQRMPRNVSEDARAAVEEEMAPELEQIRGGWQVSPDIIEQKAQAAVLRLIPGSDGIRLAAIASNIAIAADKYRLVQAHSNNLIVKGPNWPDNRENLSPYCIGMKENIRDMFYPFIDGPEAILMNVRSSATRLRDPIRNIVDSICTVVDEAQDAVNTGREIQFQTADRLKQTIREDLEQKWKPAFSNTLSDIIVAVAVPF
jgi:hypothetical protein